MYYPYFITYMVVGFAISLLVFFWALKNSQFAEQQRARFLPLEEEPEPPVKKASKINRIETFALGFLACIGLATTASVLIFALVSGGMR